MSEEKLETRLSEMARDYHEPPATPREEIWARIQTERRARATSGAGRGLRLLWGHPALRWGVGIAAALAIGVGIGRVGGGEDQASARVAEEQNGGTDTESGDMYRWAAVQHLGQVEAFLAMFRADASTGRPVTESRSSARDLLSTTRLLLDSPVNEDAQLRTLLEDIELVLAQIAQFPTGETARAEAREELELIDRSLDQRGVLLRLQSVIGAGALAGVQGAL
jgi:hypothetical protein